jgi:hypothetical protein
VAQWFRKLDYLKTHTSLSPIRHGFAPGFVNYKKGYTRLTAASDKAYQLLAYGWWFSPCTPASSTTKTSRHDIAEILLKVVLNTKIKSNQNQSHSDSLSSSLVDQLKQLHSFQSCPATDKAFRSCYSNITLLKFYDWSVGHKNK